LTYIADPSMRNIAAANFFAISNVNDHTFFCYSLRSSQKNGEVIGFDWFTTNHTVELIPDPENQYDPGAIKVLLSGEFVGFIPRDKTHIVDVTLEARVYEFRKNESLELYQGQLKVNVGPKQHSNESAAQNIPLLSATI